MKPTPDFLRVKKELAQLHRLPPGSRWSEIWGNQQRWHHQTKAVFRFLTSPASDSKATLRDVEDQFIPLCDTPGIQWSKLATSAVASRLRKIQKQNVEVARESGEKRS
jgi:hypothetical protein